MSAQYLPLLGSAYAAELALGLWLAQCLPELIEGALAYLAWV